MYQRPQHLATSIATEPPEIIGRSLLWRNADCLPLSARGCSLCAEACPVGALAFGEGVPAVSSLCTGCARCTAVCPTDALKLKDFPPPAAPDKAVINVYIDCTKVPRLRSPAGCVRVPCMGGISPGWLLALQDSIGNATIIALDRGWCQQCSSGDTSSCGAAKVVSDTGRMLAGAGVDAARWPRIESRPLPLSQMPDEIPASLEERVISRRGFFVRGLSEMARAAEGSIRPGANGRSQQTSSLGTLPPVVPAEQIRRITAIRNIGKRLRTVTTSFDLPVVVIVAEGCSNHRVCTVVCPSGALTRYENEGSSGIRFNALLCIGCRQCERSCPEQALQFWPQHKTNSPGMEVELTCHEIKACTTCEDEFSGVPGEKCPVCRKTEALFSAHATFNQSICEPPA